MSKFTTDRKDKMNIESAGFVYIKNTKNKYVAMYNFCAMTTINWGTKVQQCEADDEIAEV